MSPGKEREPVNRPKERTAPSIEQIFKPQSPAKILLFDSKKGILTDPMLSWGADRTYGRLLRSTVPLYEEQYEYGRRVPEYRASGMGEYMHDEETAYMATLLLTPPVEKTQILERQQLFSELASSPHLDELIKLKNEACRLLRGIRRLGQWEMLGDFNEVKLIELAYEGKLVIPAFDSIDGHQEAQFVKPDVVSAREHIDGGLEALRALAGHEDTAKDAVFPNLTKFVEAVQRRVDALIPPEIVSGDHPPYDYPPTTNDEYWGWHKEVYGSGEVRYFDDPLGSLERDLITPYLLKGGAVLEIARKIRDEEWAKATLDESLPSTYKKGWNIRRPKDEQVTNDSMDEVSKGMLASDNTSGKSFNMDSDLLIRMSAQSTGFAPVAEGNFSIQETFAFIDRHTTQADQNMSAFMSEVRSWQELLPYIGPRSRVYIDEGYSTTSPEDQARLLWATAEYIAQQGGSVVLATHNDMIVDQARSTPDTQVYHLATDIDGEGNLVRHFRLLEGAGDSHAFAVAQMRGFPTGILTTAEAYYGGERPPINPTEHSYPAIEGYSEDVRSRLKREAQSLEHLFPTSAEGSLFSLFSLDKDFQPDSILRHMKTGRKQARHDYFGISRQQTEEQKELLGKMILWGPASSSQEVLERQKLFDTLLKDGLYEKIHELITEVSPETIMGKLFTYHPDLPEDTEEFPQGRGEYKRFRARMQRAFKERKRKSKQLIDVLRSADSVYLHQAANFIENGDGDQEPQTRTGDQEEILRQVQRAKLNHLGEGRSPLASIMGKSPDSEEPEVRILRHLDALCLFADIATQEGFAHAEFNDTGDIAVNSAFNLLKPSDDEVANDIFIGQQENKVVALSGPNGSGKTFHGKNTVISLLTGLQTGYVPATQASIPLLDGVAYFDRVIQRQGSELSAFSQEVEYWKALLSTARGKKAMFVMADEAFSTTSPAYQAALTYGVVAEFLKNPHLLMFATHNHEVVRALEESGSVAPYHFRFNAADGKVEYEYKLQSGHEESYAIEVARTLGLPEEILS